MNVTESRFKNRQLHMEDYLQMVSAEQKEYAEVFDYRKIAEKSSIITGYWTDNLLDLILRKDNLNKAYKRVKSNKGAGGTDGMQVDELLPYLKENQETLIWQIRNGRYKPNPVRRVEIPKETKGEYRKLGVPTVVDRVIQQAITQELMPIYEEQFSENRFGFRPQKGQHDALRQCQKNVNDGYVYVVDMDLEKFFDTVCQSKLIEVLSRTIKDGRVISLIHKYLNAGVLVKGMYQQFVRGWVEYYKLADMKSLLKETDQWARRRIRAVYWKQWKKPRTRYRMLRALKCEHWVAREMIRCRKGYWRIQYVGNRIIEPINNPEIRWHVPRLTRTEWEELYGDN